MGTTRIFLLRSAGDDADLLAALADVLRQAGHDLAELVVEQDVLRGDDAAALRVLAEIRSAMAHAEALLPADDQARAAGLSGGFPQPLLIGVGLGASLALWVDALDLPKPRKIRLGAHVVALEREYVSAPVLAGVVAIGPFLGFDFSLRQPRLGAIGASGLRLRLCRRAFWAKTLGALHVPMMEDHGLHATRPPSWAELARVLSFASVVEVLPSLKRPTALILDAAGQAANVEVLLRSLSGRVSVLDSPMRCPHLSQVTLAAVDWILKGAPPPDD